MQHTAQRTLGSLLIAGVVFSLTTPAAHGDFFEYFVVQGTSETQVTPIQGPDTVQSFYGYGTFPLAGASSNTPLGLETSNTSILFLYDGVDGPGNPELSLVMIHDRQHDGSGGRVVFEFTGLPLSTSFSIRDDGAPSEGVLPVSNWRWNNANTDGGALTGGLTNAEWCFTIDAWFPAGGGLSAGSISSWQFLSGDGPVTSLAEQTPLAAVTLCSRLVIEVDIDIKPGSDPNSFNPNGNGVIPVAINGGADFDVLLIDPDTLTLNGSAVRTVGKKNKLQVSYEDWNADGYLDLVAKFADDPGNWPDPTTTGLLRGLLLDGTDIQGIDAVNIVP